MELIQQKSELFRKSINNFNQNKLLKFKKYTYNGVETSIKSFENDFAKAKEVLTEFSRRSEELLDKIKSLRLENQNKRDILDAEEIYISDMKEKDLKKLEDNIFKFQDQLQKESQDYNIEKTGLDESKKKTLAKYEALQAFVACYEDNLGLTFEKSRENNFLIVFQYLNQLTIKERYSIELTYDEDSDRFISKEEIIRTQPEIPSLAKLSEDLNDTRNFLKFLIKARKEFMKLAK